jgi:hypothetical protein
MVKKYHKKRRGGFNEDIEAGVPENVTPIQNVPPDPERFKNYETTMLQKSFNPITREEAATFFEGPTPENKQVLENKKMFNEDPLYSNPLDEEMIELWSDKGGKRKTYKRRNHKRETRKRRTYKKKNHKRRSYKRKN